MDKILTKVWQLRCWGERIYMQNFQKFTLILGNRKCGFENYACKFQRQRTNEKCLISKLCFSGFKKFSFTLFYQVFCIRFGGSILTHHWFTFALFQLSYYLFMREKILRQWKNPNVFQCLFLFPPPCVYR